MVASVIADRMDNCLSPLSSVPLFPHFVILDDDHTSELDIAE